MQDIIPGIHRRNRGYLPHWEVENGRYHVIFRLADSLPDDVLLRLSIERERLLDRAHDAPPHERPFLVSRVNKVLNYRLDKWLDRGIGECHLRDPRIAGLVASALDYFDAQRYLLITRTIMPNHVHVIFQAMDDLAKILHSWKSYTAVEANRILGRRGTFWQKEPWDRWIRDDRDLIRTVRYVEENPVRAGLTEWPWVKVWRERLRGL